MWPQCWPCAVCAVGRVGCCVGGGVPCGGKHIIIYYYDYCCCCYYCTAVCPLQDIASLRGCCAQVTHLFTPTPALPILVQYYCTITGQYKTPPPTSRLYAIHNTILVITTSCKGQTVPQRRWEDERVKIELRPVSVGVRAVLLSKTTVTPKEGGSPARKLPRMKLPRITPEIYSVKPLR